MSSTPKTFGIAAGYRVNAQAVTWESQPGEYWTPQRVETSRIFQYHVYELAAALARQRAPVNLLDVGSGPGTKIRELLLPFCSRIVCVDQPTVRQAVAASLPQAEFFGSDLEAIDLDLGAAFDMVLCADVLEHLNDPDACVDFLRRSLKPNGVAIISTPERCILRGPDCVHCPKPEHVREWSKAEFAGYLRSRRFEIQRQLLLPVGRLATWEFSFSRIFGSLWRLPRWHACQTVVCGPGAGPAGPLPTER